MNYIRIRNETSIGSITAFALDVDGRLYGLSAAHVLLGENKDADPYDIIKIRNTETKRWINAGVLVKSVYSNGLDMFSDFGAIDAGIFELNREFKNRVRHELRPLKYSKYLQGNPEALKGKTLYSYSPMQDKKIRATIKELFYKTSTKHPRKFDLVLENVDPGKLTKKGDSGIIWKDANGRAVAMHIRGDRNTNRFSYATFINRVTKSLDIRLLQR